MPHAIWRGTISFGLVSIPVSVFSAENRRELAFHLIDRRDASTVHNLRVNAVTGQEVPWDEIVKGYEFEPGVWVTLTDDDFRAANVEATQTIGILGAVCRDDVPVEYFDKPYYLEPEKPGRKPYALLRETLARAGRVALAKVVIRTRQHLALVVPEGEALLLELVRYPYELRDTSSLDLPSSDVATLGVTDAELSMARQLVAAMETEWDPAEAAYQDTYHDDLLALIRRKASGADVAAPPPQAAEEAEGKVIDIVALLKASIEERRSGEQGAHDRRSGRSSSAGG